MTNTENDKRKTLRLQVWQRLEPRLKVYLCSFKALSCHDREDILQESLMAFWLRSPLDEAEARAWAYRVCRNKAIDFMRGAERKIERAAVEGCCFERVASKEPSPEELSMTGEDERFVRSFLSDLEDRERELLHLAFAEDMSYPEIGRVLKMPVGTVKWKIAALKGSLGERYRKEYA